MNITKTIQNYEGKRYKTQMQHTNYQQLINIQNDKNPKINRTI